MLFNLNRFLLLCLFICLFSLIVMGLGIFCSQGTETCDTGKHLSLAYLAHPHGMGCKCLSGFVTQRLVLVSFQISLDDISKLLSVSLEVSVFEGGELWEALAYKGLWLAQTCRAHCAVKPGCVVVYRHVKDVIISCITPVLVDKLNYNLNYNQSQEVLWETFEHIS